MELSVEKEMCQMSDEQEDSLLEKTLKIKKNFFAAFAIWVTQIFFDFKKMCLGNTFLMACKYVYVSGLRAQQHRSQQFTTVLWYVSRCAPQYTAQPSFPAHWATRPSWDEKEQDTPDTPGGSTEAHFPFATSLSHRFVCCR